MWRQWLFSLVVAGVTAGLASTSLAQDKLATIVVKQKLAKEDRTQIEAEATSRVKQLGDATTEKDRGKATEKILATAKTQGATKAGLDAYADACASQLEPLVRKDTFETAFSAVRVLAELDSPNTTPALAAAMQSRYAAVRYQAARNLQALHARLKGDQDKCKTALLALGEAGALERDKLVLGAIYQAINFYVEVPDFQAGDDCARALNLVFAGRAKQLTSGGIDETLDEPGFAAAAACYPSASAEEQVKLARYLSLFLTHAVNRYFAADTAEESLPTLAGSVKKTEDALRAMITAAKKDPPRSSIGTELSGKGAAAKKKPAAEAALKELLDVLKDEPWRLS